jgi:hypothetical protein
MHLNFSQSAQNVGHEFGVSHVFIAHIVRNLMYLPIKFNEELVHQR